MYVSRFQRINICRFSFAFLDHVVVEYSSMSVDSAASVFRVDTINQHSAQKPKRFINNGSENLKTYIWQLVYR